MSTCKGGFERPAAQAAASHQPSAVAETRRSLPPPLCSRRTPFRASPSRQPHLQPQRRWIRGRRLQGRPVGAGDPLGVSPTLVQSHPISPSRCSSTAPRLHLNLRPPLCPLHNRRTTRAQVSCATSWRCLARHRIDLATHCHNAFVPTSHAHVQPVIPSRRTTRPHI